MTYTMTNAFEPNFVPDFVPNLDYCLDDIQMDKWAFSSDPKISDLISSFLTINIQLGSKHHRPNVEPDLASNHIADLEPSCLEPNS